MHVLFVCTGNQCRSPVAAAWFARYAAVRQICATVSSAGLLDGGRPAHPSVVSVMGEWGFDLHDHRSRPIDAEEVSTADLVVGMGREHVREVAVIRPDALAKTFTLRELVRRARGAGARPAQTPLARWLEILSGGRDTSDLLGASAEDDIADPLRGPQDEFQATVRVVGGLVEEMVDLLWPRPGVG